MPTAHFHGKLYHFKRITVENLRTFFYAVFIFLLLSGRNFILRRPFWSGRYVLSTETKNKGIASTPLVSVQGTDYKALLLATNYSINIAMQ